MKKCTVCRTEKDISCFGKKKAAHDGLRPACKECEKIKATEYKRSKIGMIKGIYNDQKNNSKSRGYNSPEYTVNELHKWMISQDIFHELYDRWVKSGYKTGMRPSCDRYSETELGYDYKPYNLNRLRVVTFADNMKSRDNDIMSGRNNKLSKSVIEIDIDGNILNEYHSVSEASRITGRNNTSISNYCIGKQKPLDGSIWRFK